MRERLPDKNAIVEPDFRNSVALTGEGCVVEKKFKLAFVFIDINDRIRIRDLFQDGRLIRLDLYSGIEHFEQQCCQPTQLCGQKAAVILGRAGQQPVEPPILREYNLHMFRFF
jgi:hypothetical protein